jgi:hypothetical protein
MYRAIYALTIDGTTDDAGGGSSARWFLACGHSVDIASDDGLHVVLIEPQWCPTCAASAREGDRVEQLGATFRW